VTIIIDITCGNLYNKLTLYETEAIYIYVKFTPVNCYPFSDWWSSVTMGPVDDGTRRPSTKPHHDIQQREIRVMHANEPFYYVHGHVT
jgi:hypothetical protein